MSGKKRRRPTYRPPPGSAPAGRAAPGPAPRRGLLDSLTAPRAARGPVGPGIGRSLVHGMVTACSSPWIVGTGFGLVLAIWLVAVLAGFRGPASLLVNVASFPPVSTWSVDVVPSTLAGAEGGWLALSVSIATIVVRALIHAGLAGLVVDQLRTGAASRWSFVRSLRAFPTTLAVALAGFMLLTVGAALAPLLGTLSLLVLLGALVFGVYLFAYAPFVAITERIGALGALSTSMRVARVPGSGNLGFAAIYAMPSIVLLLVPKPGSDLGVNPSIGAWLIVLVTTLVHLVFLGAFAFRYLSVADDGGRSAPRR